MRQHGKVVLGQRWVAQGGFTLVEVVVAILILAVVLLGVSGLLSTARQGTVRAGIATQALNLAQEKLEEIKDDPGLVAAEEYPVEVEGTFTDYPDYTYRITASPDESETLLQVTVTVLYHGVPGEQQVSLTTLTSTN